MTVNQTLGVESRGSFGRYLVTILEGGDDVNERLLSRGQKVAFMD